jgi:hypothetical protein
MAVIDTGSSTAGKANVNSTYDLQVALPDATTPSRVGGLRIFSENDAGAITGSPYLVSPETSDDYRLRVGVDTILFQDSFNATAQNTANWKHVFTTQTMVQASGFLVTNNNLTATTATGCYLQTWRHFPFILASQTYAQFELVLDNTVQANQELYIGLFSGVAAATVPADGAYIKITSAGTVGVIDYAGSKTASTPIANKATGASSKYTIAVADAEVEFWRDDELFAVIELPTGNAQPFATTSLPFCIHSINVGAVAGTPARGKIGCINISQGDIATFRPWAQQMAGSGLMAYQGQNGGTMGTTALLPNATAATVVTGGAISQTVAIATGLGGQAGIVANVAGADGLVTAFQVPLGSATQTPRNLVITGIRIDSVNIGAAVATTASVLQWSLAFGATGGTIPSLAQAETGSFVTATAKAWRRVPLGLQSWILAAGIGTPAEPITVPFDSPIIVAPGEWVASVAKFIVGTATPSQVIWATVTFTAHYE